MKAGRRMIHCGKDILKKITKQLKKDINIHERVKKGQIGAPKEGKVKLVEEKYGGKRKGLGKVI